MRKFNRGQLVADLVEMYPEVMRLALVLTGREDVARGVGRFVISRAVPAWLTWTDDDQRRAWFFHHTLLTTRRVSGHKPDPRNDFLLTGQTSNIEYAAFIRALRALPFQQAEAFLLFEVMGFDLRRSAVTMDLSTTATSNHLDAARKALQALAPQTYDTLLSQLRTLVFTYTTDQQVSIPAVQKAVRRYLLPRRIRRLVGLATLGGVAYLAWRVLG